MNYHELEAEHLASNESFLNWYFKRNKGDVSYWDELITSNPILQPKVDQAVTIIQSLNGALSGDDTVPKHDAWNRLEQQIESQNQHVAPTNKDNSKFRRPLLLGIAASIILVALSLLWIFGSGNKTIIYTTDYGETTSITLPDNSVVTLNSNSSLQYPKSFASAGGARKVWLQGEAYFSVVSTTDQQKFLVHTPDNVVVQVLGTEFNVKHRKSGTKVVLNSGKISLNIREQPEQVIMEPGELVSIPTASSDFIKMPVNTDLHTSWKCKIFVFDDTPFSEVISLLEENYGLSVKITDNSILDQKVSGSVPSDNIKLLMDGLSESFGLTIQHSQNTVKIMKQQ